jgi:hypothetical protein
MMMLIHRICIALRGDGRPHMLAIATSVSAAMDVLNWKRTKLRMFA